MGLRSFSHYVAASCTSAMACVSKVLSSSCMMVCSLGSSLSSLMSLAGWLGIKGLLTMSCCELVKMGTVAGAPTGTGGLLARINTGAARFLNGGCTRAGIGPTAPRLNRSLSVPNHWSMLVLLLLDSSSGSSLKIRLCFLGCGTNRSSRSYEPCLLWNIP
jgi:hypothetical protein